MLITKEKDGIELLDLTRLQKDLINDTIANGSSAAYNDMFNRQPELEEWFSSYYADGRRQYRPLPRLRLSL